MSFPSLLVLSDIHFGKWSVSNDFALPGFPQSHAIPNARSMKESLIETVRREAHLDLRGILVTGDLTSIASPSEFEGSMRVVNEITSGLGLDPKKVAVTFGNHDVDWRICALKNNDNPLPDDELYDHVAGHVGAIFASNEAFTKQGPLPGSGVVEFDDIIVYVANSGFFCVREQDYPHGRLGKEQLAWLENELTLDVSHKWRILVLHHHPMKYSFPTLVEDISCLEEGPELVEIAAGAGVHMIIHGHRHEPKLFTRMETTWKHPMTFLCAGSLAVNPAHRSMGELGNYFHIVELHSQDNSNNALGVVRSYEYTARNGWIPIEQCAKAPLDAVQFFGSVETDHEIQLQAKRIVSAAAGDNGWLPDHSQLASGLKCLRLNDLNQRLLSAAVAEGIQLVGKYPEKVLAIKSL